MVPVLPVRAFVRGIAILVFLGTVTLYAEDGAAPSKGELAARSEKLAKSVDDGYRQLLALKEKAKKQNDVIRLNCVNDKLVQFKAKMNLADTAKSSLDSAIESESPDSLKLMTEYEGVVQETRVLLEEGRSCIGEPELYKQEAGADVQVPDRPDDPGVIDPYDPGGGGPPVEPPGYASPFN
jgi:hypothetical protein